MANKYDTAVDRLELAKMLVYSFRYCIKRTGYVVVDCANMLEVYWDDIPKPWRALIKREINHAFDDYAINNRQDKDQWQRVLKYGCEHEN